MRYRTVSAFIIAFLMFLTAGCGTPIKPQANVSTNPPMVAGFWEDKQVPVAVCDGIAQVGITLDILQKQKNSLLTGFVTLQFRTDQFELPFSGQIDDAGQITGKAKTYDFNIDLLLTLKNNKVEGTLTDMYLYECEDGSSSKAVMTVGLEKEMDALEPNNEVAQATQIELNKEYLLTLHSSDPDWFSLILTAPQIVTFSASEEGNSGVTYTLMDDKQKVISEHSMEPSFGRVMQPGQYYLKVQTHSGRHAYKLKVEAKNLPDIAFEPNDTWEQATQVNLSTVTNLYVFTEDEDWLTFTLDEVYEVTFSFEGWGMATLYNDQKEAVFDTFSDTQIETILNPGKYYFKVFGADATDALGVEYSIVASQLTPLGKGDPEPNNIFKQAVTVNINTDYKDYYLLENDIDWFIFSLDTTSIISFGSNPGLNLFQLKNNVLVQTQVDFGGVFPLMLYPGTYYLEVFSSNSMLYDLRISARDLPDLAYEPNDNFTQATPLTINGVTKEFVVTRDDSDWFSFTVNASTSVVLETDSFELMTSLYSEGMNPIFTNSSDPWTQQLDPGTYYLKISPTYNYSVHHFRLRTWK